MILPGNHAVIQWTEILQLYALAAMKYNDFNISVQAFQCSTSPLQSLTYYLTTYKISQKAEFCLYLAHPEANLLPHFISYSFHFIFLDYFTLLSSSSCVAIFHFRLSSWEEFGVNDISLQRPLWNLCSQVKTAPILTYSCLTTKLQTHSAIFRIFLATQSYMGKGWNRLRERRTREN